MPTPQFLPLFPSLPRLKQYAEDYEDDAYIEREVEFAGLAEEDEGEEDGVARLEVVGEIDSECRQLLQRLNLKQIHAYGAEQGVAEHPPKVGSSRNDHNGLIGREDHEIERNDDAYTDNAATHLIHQHGARPHSYADLLVVDGIKGADG